MNPNSIYLCLFFFSVIGSFVEIETLVYFHPDAAGDGRLSKWVLLMSARTALCSFIHDTRDSCTALKAIRISLFLVWLTWFWRYPSQCSLFCDQMYCVCLSLPGLLLCFSSWLSAESVLFYSSTWPLLLACVISGAVVYCSFMFASDSLSHL